GRERRSLCRASAFREIMAQTTTRTRQPVARAHGLAAPRFVDRGQQRARFWQAAPYSIAAGPGMGIAIAGLARRADRVSFFPRRRRWRSLENARRFRRQG